jgi:hypothetical protein
MVKDDGGPSKMTIFPRSVFDPGDFLKLKLSSAAFAAAATLSANRGPRRAMN